MKNLLMITTLSSVETIVVYISIGAIVLLFAVLGVFAKKDNKFDTKTIAYAALCVAMSFALSYFKISLGYGGSITIASLLPLVLFAYSFGFSKSLFVGLIYGLLQYIQSPYFLNVFQFLYDFIFPFASIAFLGLFNKSGAKGLFLGIGLYFVARLASHVAAGMIFFNMGWVVTLPIFGDVATAFLYSLAYNSLFMIPDTAIFVAVLVGLLATKQFHVLVKQMRK